MPVAELSGSSSRRRPSLRQEPDREGTQVRPVSIHKQVTVLPHSTKTELHFVPRANVGRAGGGTSREEWVVARPDSVSLDWAEMDPVPVRVSKGTPRGRATPAMYFWQRTKSHVWCESQTEKSEVMWLDYGGQVERMWSQPFAVVFGHDTTMARRWHVPDFLAELADGRMCALDVRPKELVQPDDRRKFDATADVCSALGWGYQLLTGHDRNATDVLRWLAASRHQRCAPPTHVEDQLLALARHGATRRALCQAVSPKCPPLACAWVDHLAWHGRLRVDLHLRFDSNTIYSTADEQVRR